MEMTRMSYRAALLSNGRYACWVHVDHEAACSVTPLWRHPLPKGQLIWSFCAKAPHVCTDEIFMLKLAYSYI